MLCGCLESPFGSSSQQPQNQAISNGSSLTSSFPGQRRFVKTGGNALVEYDPSKHGIGSHHGSVGSGTVGNGNTQVSVTVPSGVSPGQTIQVAAPDGRMVSASVPPGMTPGSTFIVQFPPANHPQQQQQAIVPEGRNPSTSTSGDVAIPIDAMQATSNSSSYHGVKVLPPPTQASQPSAAPAAASAVPIPVPPAQPYSPAPPSVASNLHQQKKMVLVKVPPGTAPGTTLHVKIPGENRMVAAQVPPGVPEFQVAYEPAPEQAAVAPLPVPVPPPQSTAPSPPLAASNHHHHQQKMILVKVPPGTAPGTTLHVQIPGENRMIAAQVPPGVSEFHVSCPTQGAPLQQQQQQQQPPNRQQQNSSSANGCNNGFGSGMGSMIPMVAGGALMGAAGMAMYDHAAHTSNNNYAGGSNAYADNDYNAGAGNNDDGGGYGMGDYDDSGGGFDGGDFDGGGFDF